MKNEYRVPEDMSGAVVVDIGMHVGAFSHLALTRGAHELHGFEPETSNYSCVVQNLAPFGARVHLHNRAVWRSDLVAPALSFRHMCGFQAASNSPWTFSQRTSNGPVSQ